MQKPRPGDLEEMLLELLPRAAPSAALSGGDIAILGIAAALGLADAARRRARLRRRK